MTLELIQNGHMMAFSDLEQAALSSGVAERLLAASVMGGSIGLLREYKHRPSGLRTNLLICLGASLFTFLSPIIAGEVGTNKGQIASNIVQGIGFLGAGLILHNRSHVSGMASAATVWAVAAIGMACGAGLYVPALISTVLVLVVLEAVGLLETNLNLKTYTMVYEVRGSDANQMTAAVLAAMDSEKRRLPTPDRDTIGDLDRMTFSVVATRRTHDKLAAGLKASQGIDKVLTFRDAEDE
jgi:putative Mg2+ transporter-C (MgtC) family protein